MLQPQPGDASETRCALALDPIFSLPCCIEWPDVRSSEAEYTSHELELSTTVLVEIIAIVIVLELLQVTRIFTLIVIFNSNNRNHNRNRNTCYVNTNKQ